MSAIKFKTNIQCGSCLAKVTPGLNSVAGENNWQVDLNNPQKILTVKNEDVSEEQVLESIKKVGFRGERID